MKRRTSKRRQQVLDLVRAKPGLTREQIAAELKLPGPYTAVVIRRLAREGAVRATKKLGRGPAGKVFPADAAQPDAPAEPRKRRRKGAPQGALASMPLDEFVRFCQAADLELEQGLALGYQLIVRQLTRQLAEGGGGK